MTKKLWLNKNGVLLEDACGLKECEHCPYEIDPPKEFCDCDARKVRCLVEKLLKQRDDRGEPIYELTQKPSPSGYTHAVYHWDEGKDEEVVITEPAGKLYPAIKSFDPEEEERPEFEGHKYRILTYAAQLNRIDLDYEPLADYPKTIVIGCRCEYERLVDPLATAENSEDELDHYVWTYAPRTTILYDFELGRPVSLLWGMFGEDSKTFTNLCAPYLCELYREMFRIAAATYGYTPPEDENGILFRRCLLDSSSGESSGSTDPYDTGDGVSCGPVYEPYGPVYAFMDAGEGYYIIDCGCSVQFLQHHSACPSSYWKAHVWPDACRCVDWRNVYLDYADELGIVDFSWGSNTKYSYSYLYPDWETGGWKVTTEKAVWSLGSCSDGCDQYNYGYLDYDLLLAIRRDCKGQLWIGTIGQDATFSPRDYASPYLAIEFLGHVEPFAEDPDLGFTWRCPIVVWHYGGNEYPDYNCFDTEAEASEYAHDAGNPVPYVCGLADYYQGPMASKLDVSFPLKLVPGKVTYDEWNGQWCAHSAVWTAVDEGGYIINYLETSRGFLVNGLEGYYASITIRGIRPYITLECGGGEGQLYEHNHVPLENTTLIARITKVQGCLDEDGNPTSDLQDAWDLWRGADPSSPGERLPSDPFAPIEAQPFPFDEETTT